MTDLDSIKELNVITELLVVKLNPRIKALSVYLSKSITKEL